MEPILRRRWRVGISHNAYPRSAIFQMLTDDSDKLSPTLHGRAVMKTPTIKDDIKLLLESIGKYIGLRK
jgi:hypothetical protein